jgi:hypothetical protein
MSLTSSGCTHAATEGRGFARNWRKLLEVEIEIKVKEGYINC